MGGERGETEREKRVSRQDRWESARQGQGWGGRGRGEGRGRERGREKGQFALNKTCRDKRGNSSVTVFKFIKEDSDCKKAKFR